MLTVVYSGSIFPLKPQEAVISGTCKFSAFQIYCGKYYHIYYSKHQMLKNYYSGTGLVRSVPLSITIWGVWIPRGTHLSSQCWWHTSRGRRVAAACWPTSLANLVIFYTTEKPHLKHLAQGIWQTAPTVVLWPPDSHLLSWATCSPPLCSTAHPLAVQAPNKLIVISQYF